MPLISNQILNALEQLRTNFSEAELEARFKGRENEKPSPSLRGSRRADAASISLLWEQIVARFPAAASSQSPLADDATVGAATAYGANIENMIGTVKVPMGIVGPIRVNGLYANGDYLMPLATTEAALVASYARGADLVSRANGAATALLNEGVLRTPAFRFSSVLDAGRFVDWVVRNADDLKAAAETATRHGKLISIEPFIDHDVVFLLCRYTTGEASGQNMVTMATDALCLHIEANCPFRPRHWFIEANFSGDKKATHLGLITGRGRKVTASVTLPAAVVERGLHVSVERMIDYARLASLGAMLSGQLGAQGHYANGLAAFYIATGQDAACVAESAVGFTRMEQHGADLFVSVTLPNVLVGTVGGGTGLPSQSAALRLVGVEGQHSGAALAELVAALCLCGEISIAGAIAAGEFTSAHRKLARER